MAIPEAAGRRLLVITYHFPPDGSVGGLRWAGITKYLARLGWEVVVVTAVPPSGSDAAVGVQVESCPRFRTLLDAYQGLRRLAQRPRASFPDASSVARPSEPAGLLRRLRREVEALLTLPDQSRGWVLRAALRARSVCRQFQPQVVVSSGPPHSAHLVARMATMGNAVRWFVDLRDPWAGPIATAWQSHPVIQTRVFRALVPRAERLAFRAAHGVIANTPQLAEALAARYPDVAVTCIPNGVDPECLPPPASRLYPGLGVAYAGTLFGSHDLGPVMRALRLLFERHPEAAQAGSKLRVVGHADASCAVALDEQVGSLGLEQYVEVLGPLPRAQALDVVSRSRLAVVLAQELEMQIPAKLYELVAMGIPTLVLAGERSAAGVEGNRLGAVALDPNDVAGIACLLEQLWRDDSQQRSPCPASITYDAIAARVDTLLRGNGAAPQLPRGGRNRRTSGLAAGPC
ncbi:MAG: hypothetical protein AUH78_05180 [Gemmatimonadetes bacterium 13_1_40CM_4_69_8]|uniref:Glycosyltransferase family 4 protein n=1 Tax=Candidatus Segetimicrobium genomatis TaxID=2569760 RepID=A0A537KKQ5_9BACT|nr:MAG: hypothetical protein AUH78_05180 [Gemmatimonadetes bacterium 13_1_40CM_4_69_8]PYP71040.1 MAG: hypothetical protein DMD41_13535 [Gemmatimonadota bacterium]TMI96357.1 MAG: glycosyltransferase family 4 protein [Terrabacteria group bacterium ANGP1]